MCLMKHAQQVLAYLNDEIDQLVLVHRLSVEVGDQEANVISLDGLSSKHVEVVSSKGKKLGELAAEDLLNLIGLQAM